MRRARCPLAGFPAQANNRIKEKKKYHRDYAPSTREKRGESNWTSVKSDILLASVVASNVKFKLPKTTRAQASVSLSIIQIQKLLG
jgi:hypothetical protein